MIIDVHTHAWPDKVAERAKEHLETAFDTRLVAVPTVGNLLRSMDRNGIDVSFIASVASRPEQVASINSWLFSVKNDRLRCFAAMHPFYEKREEELKRVRENAAGIKLQPEFQEFYVDDEKVFPLYERLQEYRLPVLFHCGEELSGTRVVRASPERMLRVHQRFPDLTIIAAHLGGFRMWDDVARHLAGAGMYMDTAFVFGHLQKDKLKEMLAAHSPEKILFGTDFPLADQKKDREYLEALDIDDESKIKIFHKNAEQLFK